MRRRTKPRQHVRKLKSGKRVVVNKGVKKRKKKIAKRRHLLSDDESEPDYEPVHDEQVRQTFIDRRKQLLKTPKSLRLGNEEEKIKNLDKAIASIDRRRKKYLDRKASQLAAITKKINDDLSIPSAKQIDVDQFLKDTRMKKIGHLIPEGMTTEKIEQTPTSLDNYEILDIDEEKKKREEERKYLE